MEELLDDLLKNQGWIIDSVHSEYVTTKMSSGKEILLSRVHDILLSNDIGEMKLTFKSRATNEQLINQYSDFLSLSFEVNAKTNTKSLTSDSPKA